MTINLNFWQIDDAIKINTATFLVINDTPTFSNFISSLYEYDENISVRFYDEKINTIKNSELLIVTDVLGYNINSTSVLKMIYKEIEEQLNLDLETKSLIEKMANKITSEISSKLIDHELNLVYDEITVMELLTALGIKVDEKQYTISEKIISIIEIFHYLSKKKLLIFNSVLAYLTEAELRGIIELIELSKLNVLFIEHDMKKWSNQYILDSDFNLLINN